MKKGFTMIELIFVIVILGILASVAIPRLAGTRDDAEISAAVANLRTLVSDANVYYVTKGSFKAATGTTNAKWGEITSVPLTITNGANTTSAGETVATTAANLKVGDVNDCITVTLVEKTTGTNATPAHIQFTKKSSAAGVCATVLESNPLKPYLEAKIPGNNTAGKMAIGSNTSIYPTN